MNKVVKPGIILCIICVVAATILGVAYIQTYDIIELRKEETKNASMREVLKDATTFEDLNLSNEDVSSVFVGKNGEDIVGYAIFTHPVGYSGEIELLTGVNTNGAVTGISILSMSETPGLGANAEKPAFKEKFVGKTGQVGVVKTEPAGDNEIVAMTSATITSKAVAAGVNTSLEFYQNEIKGVQ